jgi:hypothetical protein
MKIKTPTAIVDIPVEELKEYGRNARKHSEEQVMQIVESVKLVGWGDPLLIDQNNTLIAGHGRLAAAKKLGMKAVPCIRMKLNSKQSRAFRLAHNKIALNSRWDSKELRAELADLHAEDFDLEFTGFDIGEIADFQLDVQPDDDGVQRLKPVTNGGRKIKVAAHEREVSDVLTECPECGHRFLKGDL